MLTPDIQNQLSQETAALSPSIRLAPDLVLDATSHTLAWSPVANTLHECRLTFRAKPGMESDFYDKLDALIDATELRVDSKHNPLSTAFAKALLEICDLTSLEGCLVQGVQITAKGQGTFICNNVVLIESILHVQGQLECTNLILTGSILDAKISKGALRAFCVDHTSLLRGCLGSANLDGDCEVHGLAYEMNFTKAVFESPKTLKTRLSEGLFSRANLPPALLSEADIVSLSPASVRQSVLARSSVTDSVVQTAAQLGADSRQPVAAKEPNDCVSFNSFTIGNTISLREKSSAESSAGVLPHSGAVTLPHKVQWTASRGVPKLLFSNMAQNAELPRPDQYAGEWSSAVYTAEDLFKMMAFLSLQHVPTLQELKEHVEEVKKALKRSGSAPARIQLASDIVDASYYGLLLPQNRARLSALVREEPNLFSEAFIKRLFKD